MSLNFRGKPQRLRVPLAAITAFGDPSVNFGMHLKTVGVGMSEDEQTEEDATRSVDAESIDAEPSGAGKGEVVALDTFRKKVRQPTRPRN